jgi:hypothetical protein
MRRGSRVTCGENKCVDTHAHGVGALETTNVNIRVLFLKARLHCGFSNPDILPWRRAQAVPSSSPCAARTGMGRKNEFASHRRVGADIQETPKI